MLEALKGKRTYLLAIGALVTAWCSYFGGAIDLQAAIAATFAALGGITLRSGIANTAAPVLLAVAAIGLGGCGSLQGLKDNLPRAAWSMDIGALGANVHLGVDTRPVVNTIASAVGGALGGASAGAAVGATTPAQPPKVGE